ncbi:MAG: hypothetical protein JWQ43_385 [Glaciihabitans sp.]|nr:hypothetical protein [Glaciihabitans sp.]
MSKKIEAATKRLTKAIKKHSEVVGASSVTLKKAQRAAVEIQEAAIAYALIVQEKTGIETPFPNLWNSGLEASTITSLISERDALVKKSGSKNK